VYHSSGAHSLSEASGAIEAIGRLLLFGIAALFLTKLTVVSAVFLYVGGFALALVAFALFGGSHRASQAANAAEKIDRPWSRLLSAFRIQSYQQVSGRLFIAFTIFSIDADGAGHLAVAYAFTEPLLNVARLLQPRLMRRGEADGALLRRMYGIVGAGCIVAVALAVTGADTVVADRLVDLVFGPEFLPAGALLAPMAVAITLASMNIALIGVLYRDGRSAVERLAGAMGALIILVGLLPALGLEMRIWTLGLLQLAFSASLMRIHTSNELTLVGATT